MLIVALWLIPLLPFVIGWPLELLFNKMKEKRSYGRSRPPASATDPRRSQEVA